MGRKLLSLCGLRIRPSLRRGIKGNTVELAVSCDEATGSGDSRPSDGAGLCEAGPGSQTPATGEAPGVFVGWVSAAQPTAKLFGLVGCAALTHPTTDPVSSAVSGRYS